MLVVALMFVVFPLLPFSLLAAAGSLIVRWFRRSTAFSGCS